MSVVAPAGDDSTTPKRPHFGGSRDGYENNNLFSLSLVLFVLFARPRLIWSVILPLFYPHP